MAIVIRQGTINDANWIIPELQVGTDNGHFFHTVARQALPLVHQIINSGFLQFQQNRGTSTYSIVGAELWVAEDCGAPAAFLITLIHPNKEVELHLAGTRKQFRKKGVFRALIQHTINNHNGAARIFARCYKKSTWAIDAFNKEKFKLTQKGDPIELTYQ